MVADRRSVHLRHACFLLTGALAWAPVAAQAQPADEALGPVREVQTSGTFLTEPDESETNLSGIACLEPAAETLCLVINDELQSAQFAGLTKDGLIAGAEVRLIGPDEPETAAGTPPSADCAGGEKRFKDLDGEAIAVSGSTFYVAASHGCSRKDDEFRNSFFLLARFAMDGSEQPGPVELTYRLAEALSAAPTVGAYFMENLPEDDGLNIEGLAVIGGSLYAGLRAPSLDGRAFIVKAPVDALFAPGDGALGEAPELIEVALGEGMGIRDMAALPGDRLMILAGPSGDEPDAYALVTTDLAGNILSRHVLEPVAGEDRNAKAEGLAFLGEEDGAWRMLVLYEDLPNGSPREYRVPLP